jgi:hypothetical protein
MNTRCLLLLVTAALLVGMTEFPALVADDKTAQPPSLPIVGAYHRSTSGDVSFGYYDACLVRQDGRPFVCFGLDKRPTGKEKYLYFILLKTSPGMTDNQWQFQTRSSEDEADNAFAITIGGKKVEIAHKFKAYGKTHEITSSELKIGDVEVKEGTPRVFLVDLTQEKLTCRPLKIDLPEQVPDWKDEERKTWPQTVARAVEQLREKSSEVKDFLAGPPK